MENRRERSESAIRAGDATLAGWLEIPEDAAGVVVFAHGSGSSRYSRRNNAVADHLRAAGLGTLLFDLLTAEEGRVDEATRELRFDIELLARRLGGALDWLAEQSGAASLPAGLFGSSTGAAAALIAAARKPERVAAVVSRGGRADLAGDELPRVQAPTLLVVGGADLQVLELNRRARDRMRCHTEIEIVEGASHLFEEPGALEEVERLARDWFLERFSQLRD
ncbi:MAG TPA: alpha/beta family hydrolase [Woeseiaceae bacterium]|nr:alpha/beta family hydrolase [Woeseiaceae bacterium]